MAARVTDQSRKTQYFASLQLRKDDEDDASGRNARRGKKSVCAKNTPSIVTVFGEVDPAYHKVDGIPLAPAPLRTGTPKPQTPKPSWRKAENPAPVKLHHPSAGDLVESHPEPEGDAVTLKLLAKVEALEDKVRAYDYSILQSEWEIANMKAQRTNIKSLKHQGVAVNDALPIDRQRVPQSLKPLRDRNVLIDRRLPMQLCHPDAPIVDGDVSGGGPSTQRSPPRGAGGNPLVSEVRGGRFGKRMQLHAEVREAPFSLDQSCMRCPRKRLPPTKITAAQPLLERFVAGSVSRYNDGMVADGRASRVILRDSGSTPAPKFEAAIQTLRGAATPK